MLDTSTGLMSESHMGSVIKDSDEWSFIEYMLQLSTRTSRVKLLQAWHVATPHVVNLFERRTAVSHIGVHNVSMRFLPHRHNSIRTSPKNRGFLSFANHSTFPPPYACGQSPVERCRQCVV